MKLSIELETMLKKSITKENLPKIDLLTKVDSGHCAGCRKST